MISSHFNTFNDMINHFVVVVCTITYTQTQIKICEETQHQSSLRLSTLPTKEKVILNLLIS